MNKKVVLVLAMTLVLGFSGCKKTPADDIYDKDAANMTSTDETSLVDDGTEESDGDNVTDAESIDDDITSVTDDLYEADSETVVVDIAELNLADVEGVSVDDPELQMKMLSFLKPFYYNIYFGDKNYTETGITEDDMVKFAISYVYQYENQAYKFDTTNFKLYVPEERVVELVDKYFGKKLTGHHSFEEEKIDYNGGYYLMPATDIGWNDEMKISTIELAGDFSYEVVFSVDDIEGNLVQSYKVMLEMRNERFILTSYVPIEVSAEADTSSDEETEEATSEATEATEE